MIRNLVIEIYDSKICLPPAGITVIVEGGIAEWNGKYWISRVDDADGRPIAWDVKWWSPLIHLNKFIFD